MPAGAPRRHRAGRRAGALVLPLKGGPAAKSRLGGGPRLATAIAAGLPGRRARLPRRAHRRWWSAPTCGPSAGRPRPAPRWSRESVPGSGLRLGGPATVWPAPPRMRAGGPTARAARRPAGPAPGRSAGRAGRGLAGADRPLPAGPPGWPFVPDADGSGTVLLAATAADATGPGLRPGLGRPSTPGAAPPGWTLPLPRLRRDVDDRADLRPRWRSAGAADRGAAGPRCAPRRPLRDPVRRTGTRGRPDSLERVQATVHRYDPHTGSGTVLTDDGVLVPFGPEALAGSGLRHLRSGQRLTVGRRSRPDRRPGDAGRSRCRPGERVGRIGT